MLLNCSVEKILESPFKSKETKLVNPKENQSWMFIGRTEAAAEASNSLATWWEELTRWKRPWERLKVEGEGDDRGWAGWMASLTQSTWVWLCSGSWWWTGRPGVLQARESQREAWVGKGGEGTQLSLDEQRKGHVKTQQEKRTHWKLSLLESWAQNPSSQNCEKIHVCCLSHSSGILSWQLEHIIHNSTNFSYIKQKRHYFANKGLSSQSHGFSSSHIWMWELDYKESREPKNWCIWTVCGIGEDSWGDSFGLQGDQTSQS